MLSTTVFTVFCLLVFWERPVSGRWMNSSSRAKRVVPGWTFEDRDVAYDSLKYYVMLARPRKSLNPKAVRALTPLPWLLKYLMIFISARDLRCGGSLITPRIVSTACHCLAYAVGNLDELFVKYVLMNHYLERMEAFVSDKLNIHDFDRNLFILTSAYHIHPRCSKLLYYPYYSSYDFGWVYLEKSVDETQMKYLDVLYAPAYSHSNLIALYGNVTSKEEVCLIIGHGFYNFTQASDEMRYGWVSTMNTRQCYLYSTVFSENISDLYDYDKIASWACQREFSDTQYGHEAYGDSGSPVTCNNQLFATVSSVGLRYLEPYNRNSQIVDDGMWFMTNEATVSAAFMYASDFRKEFEEQMALLAEDTKYYRTRPKLWTFPVTIDWGLQELPGHTQKQELYNKQSYAVISARVSTFIFISVFALFTILQLMGYVSP